MSDNEYAPPSGSAPVAWARAWFIAGEKPEKVRNERGRMVWPSKFKWNEVSTKKLFDDDVPLFTQNKEVSRE